MSKYTVQDPIDNKYDDSNSTSHQRLQHRVELQSLQIEKIMAKNHINARVNGGSINSGWINFDIQQQLVGGWQIFRQLTEDIISALNVPDVKIKRQNGTFKILVKKEAPHAVDLLDLGEVSPDLPGVGVTLGISEDGQPILLNLSSPDIGNVLISGLEGAGKSGLMRTFAISLALSNRQSEVQIGVITVGNGSRSFVAQPDPLFPMNYLPHLLFPVANSVEDAISALEFLVEEINYRVENNIDTPVIIVLIDDVDWLLSKGGQGVYELLAELLHAPAKAGIRSIISATDINLGGLSRLLKYDTSMRFIGRVDNADQAFYLTGELDTGAEYLNGQGDFLAVTYGNQIRFQAAYLDDYDLHLILSKLHRASRRILLARHQHGIGLNRLHESEKEGVKFSYDSENARVILEDQVEDKRNPEPSITVEQAKSERHLDGEFNDQSSLPQRRNPVELNEFEFDLPWADDQLEETNDELPGFLSANKSDQLDEEESQVDQDLGEKRQMELEYSDLEEDLDFDFVNDDGGESPNQDDSNDSETYSKRYH